MIVGEAPGRDEEIRGEPFVGAAGYELTKMLQECGIQRTECFLTNVARVRPYDNDINNFIAKAKKDRTAEHSPLRDKWVRKPITEGFALLKQEIAMVKPNMILAMGNVPLWALTGHWGVTKWRGSMLYTDDFAGFSTKVIPTIHPFMVLRQWDQRALVINDIKRAKRFLNGEPYPKPAWYFLVRPTFEQAVKELQTILDVVSQAPTRLSFDIETRSGHIACAGVSLKVAPGMAGVCIPLMCVENLDGYWREDEEAYLVWMFYQILTHKNAQVVGQNLLYDSQYTYRHWGFIPNVNQDTMISFHVAFAGLPKRLDFQASLLCDHYRYWKDDSKDWDPKLGEDQLWVYNLEDCARTHEIADEEQGIIKTLNLTEVERFQQQMFRPVLQAMIRGVRIDTDARSKMASELFEEISKREQFFIDVLGHPLNPRSPKQMKELFYEDLKLPIQIKRGTGKPTLDDDALTKLAAKEPIVAPILRKIAEHRSLGVFLSTFVQAPLDTDGRMRCSYNICGTETYRLSSSENAFGSGTNLQNIPKGTQAKEADELELPNIRKIFIPDPGYTFFDMDLDRADLQVVVWEAEDDELKQMLREGVDVHAENARTIGCSRQMAKSWVHGTNYGGSPRTMAMNCGILVREAEKMQTRWFQAHPGILRWHRETENELKTRRCVSNKWEYRRYYFDRVDALLPEALAWIPQSTVAITINKIWYNIHNFAPHIQTLLQVHDSLAGQFPTTGTKEYLYQLQECSKVVIPYSDPLIIPTGIKVSTRSWGDCG